MQLLLLEMDDITARCDELVTFSPWKVFASFKGTRSYFLTPVFISPIKRGDSHESNKKNVSKNIAIWLSYGSSKFGYFWTLDQISNRKVWRHRSKNSLEWRHRSISMKSLWPFQESGRWRKELFRSSHQLQHKSCNVFLCKIDGWIQKNRSQSLKVKP